MNDVQFMVTCWIVGLLVGCVIATATSVLSAISR